MTLAPIAEEAQHFSKKWGLSTDLAVLEHAWNLELGGLKDAARISALDHATLVVDVDSHSVMQELSLRRRELVRKLNKHLPSPFLSQITLRISHHYGR